MKNNSGLYVELNKCYLKCNSGGLSWLPDFFIFGRE